MAPMKAMNKPIKLIALAAAAAVALGLAACSGGASSSVAGSDAPSQNGQSAASSEAEKSESASSQEQDPGDSSGTGSESSAAGSQAPSIDEPAEGEQPGQLIDIETGNAAFDQKFKNNPIDQQYLKEMQNAISNVDMVTVSEKYTSLWKTEIEQAYKKLQNLAADDKEAYAEEQAQWEKDTPAALEKIYESAGSVGGSLAAVNAASQTMDYYRTRAAQIYAELYTYDPEFTYEFSAG